MVCVLFIKSASTCFTYINGNCSDAFQLKVKWTKILTFFILVQFQWNVFNMNQKLSFCMNQINILWSFSSIEASISEIFAIKNCCFLALIFVERLEKLSEKTACDVNVGQVKKSGKIKTEFFASTWRRSGLCGHKHGNNRQFVFKSCNLWLKPSYYLIFSKSTS